MCGITYIKKTKLERANKSIAKRYQKQKHRGTEGFGFVEIKNGIVLGVKRSETEKEILEMLAESTADEILFHHRTPTSTPNFVESTHPISVKHKKFKYNYLVVHNGIITNDTDLRTAHELEKFVYNTGIQKQWVTSGLTYTSDMFNDSEAVAIDLANAIEYGIEMKAKGSIAIMALQVDKKTKKAIALYYGRNSGNPLKMEDDNNFFGISSESGRDLPVDVLYRYDYETKNISTEAKKIGSLYANYTKYQEYPDYGHYDEETGTWIGTTKKDGDRIGIDDLKSDWHATDDDDSAYTEEDFDYDYEDLIANIDNKISKAFGLGDYDKMCELEDEKESLQQNYKELVREAKRCSSRRRMGFYND